MGKKRGVVYVTGIITFLSSSSESILGDITKLLYLHGVLIWVGLILFEIIGIVGGV